MSGIVPGVIEEQSCCACGKPITRLVAMQDGANFLVCIGGSRIRQMGFYAGKVPMGAWCICGNCKAENYLPLAHDGVLDGEPILADMPKHKEPTHEQ